MKEFLKSTMWFFVFVGLLAVSLYGVITPKNTPVQPVGNVQMGVFDTGLALYQGLRGKFYTLSPFNDYSMVGETREALITQKEAKEKSYHNSYNSSTIDNALQTFLAYFRIAIPSVSFQSKRMNTSYEGHADKNKVIIVRNTTFAKDNTKSRKMGMTLSFQKNDFVYDESGNSFNYQVDEELRLFEKTYGIRLTQDPGELRVPVKGNYVYITSKSIPGTLVIQAGPNQKIWVNRDAHLIEIEEVTQSQDGSYQNEMQIYSFTEPKEAES